MNDVNIIIIIIIIVTQGWVVNGVRRHAEPLEDNDPPQLCQRDAEYGYRNTKGSEGTRKYPQSSPQCPGCTLYLVHSRRPIGGAIHHRHTQLYRPYHLPYPGLILFNRLINTRAQSPILRHNSIQV